LAVFLASGALVFAGDGGRTRTGLKSPNLLRNTSFNACSVGKTPDFWGVTHVPGDQFWWKGEYFEVEEDSPVKGTKSVRLTLPEGRQKSLGINTSWHTLQIWRVYTLSVYLRSDTDGRKVTLQIGGDYTPEGSKVLKDVTVGKGWQRYSVTGTPKKKGCWFGQHWDILINGLTMHGSGTLWIAAPQLEFGEKASPYQPADADAFVPADVEKFVKFPEVRSARAEKAPSAPEIAALSAGRKNVAGPLVDAADGSELPAEMGTTFRVSHDDYNLYVLVRCNDPRVTGPDWQSPPGEAWTRDPEWGILYQDSVWLYLKPDFQGDEYFVFGASPEGRRCDVAWYDFEWDNPAWTAVPDKGKGWWGIKFTVPFHAAMQVIGEQGLGKTLGINLRRVRTTTDGSDGGLARQMWFWSPDRGTRLPCAFGKLEGLDTGRVRACRVTDGRLAMTKRGQIDVLLDVDRAPGIGGYAFLCLELIAPNGHSWTRSVPFAPDPKDRLPGPVRVEGLGMHPQEGTYRLGVSIRDESGREIGRYAQRIYVPETLKLMDNALVATLERSYYTTEPEARLLVQSNLGRSVQVKAGLEGEPMASLADAAVTVPPRGRKLLTLSIAGLPVGKHRIAVSAFEDEESGGKKQQKVVFQAFEVLQKLPPAPGGRSEIKIDRFRHIFLKKGQPLMFWADRASPEHFNTIMQGGKQDIANVAKEKGMMWIPWGAGWGRDMDAGKFATDALATGADIGGYMFHDEPGETSAPIVQRQYREIKSVDPYHPAFFYRGGWPFDAMRWAHSGIPNATDVIAGSLYTWGCANVSVYTLGQRDYYNFKIADFRLRYSRELMRVFGIPGWVNLACYHGGENVSMGSPAQHRALIFLGLVHGVRNFSEWGQRPLSDELWDAFARFKRELETLASLLGDSTAFEEDYGEAGGVRYSLWSSQGKLLLLVVNPWEAPAEFEYQVPIVGDIDVNSVKPLFDDEPQARMAGRTLKIKLGWYGSGAYLIE
jgi:hypothetical protein